MISKNRRFTRMLFFPATRVPEFKSFRHSYNLDFFFESDGFTLGGGDQDFPRFDFALCCPGIKFSEPSSIFCVKRIKMTELFFVCSPFTLWKYSEESIRHANHQLRAVLLKGALELCR